MTVTKNLPYRQDDPTWGRELMWDRAKVMEVHRRYNDASEQEASGLLRDFRGSGNTIANEGCLLTCLAMVLRLLAPRGSWTPGTLNKFARQGIYYTPAGLSMATLYADIVCEASGRAKCSSS